MNDETLPHDFAGARPATAAAAGPSRAPGSVVGQYRLVRLIAAGGMGEVYEAIQLSLERRVALKLIAPHLTRQPEFLQRFEREAKAAALLNHPNIVQVYDFGCVDGQHYLAMEFVDGNDVSELLRARGKLPVEEALSIVEQTAKALDAALEARIIHRDIKPANLLLTKSGVLKVSDLGLAKRVDEVSDMTLTGAGIGSPHFLAPEQASDARSADHRADIYSLGITLLFLLTGKRPFDRSSAFSIVLAHAQQPLPSGAELGAPLPAGVEALIRKMAAKNRDERYATYKELLEDVARVKSGLAPRAQRSRGFDRKLWAVAVAVPLVVVAILMFRQKEPVTQTQAVKTEPRIEQPALRPRGEPERGPWGRGPGGRQGRFPMPMPPPNRPERGAVPEGPIPKMMEFADNYAKENPKAYRPIVDRYMQVLNYARGTDWEDEAAGKVEDARASLETAANAAIAEYSARMSNLVKARKFQEAYDVWRDFPEAVRNFEIDRAIEAKLDAALPQDFFPEQNR